MNPSTSAIVLYARELPGFDSRVAHATAALQTAATDHAGSVVQATSLGAEDMVITDLIARHQLPVALATLQTGLLHPQTLSLLDRLQFRYGLQVELHRPDEAATLQFVARHGREAMYRSIEQRKACCDLRKMKPLARMLQGRQAWITGLRREQSDQRSEVPFQEIDGQGRHKINPLADWSWSDVWHYIARHGVPYNPLHDEFMPSVGCAPCTRAIAVGEDFRAGRWWWEQTTAKECGLHTPVAAASPTSAVAPQGVIA